MSALDTQVGGNHYKEFAIQPAEFIHKNQIGFLAGNIIKYVVRYDKKNGLQDLEKAEHYLQMLKEFYKLAHTDHVQYNANADGYAFEVIPDDDLREICDD